MKKKIFSIILMFGFSFLWVFPEVVAQEKKIQKAEESYNHYNFIDAREIYLKVVEKGHHSEEILTKLANTYYFNAEYKDAVKWYNQVFEETQNPTNPILYLRYAQSLKAIGNTEEADANFEKYNSLTNPDKENPGLEDYKEMIQLNSDRYTIKALEELYDEEQITYGHTVHDGKLIYASTSPLERSFIDIEDGWTGMSYMSLYEIPIDTINEPSGKSKELKGKIEDKYHQSSAVYTQDGETMYFTRSNYTAEDKKNKKEEQTYLKIYRAQKNKKGKWTDVEDLPINGKDFSTAHPALSPDEKTLYFASDRAGGEGETDIWKVAIEEEGKLGTPENLGSQINTKARESFPFMTKDSTLYFSSDGHFGLGGLDVFAIKLKKDGTYGNLVNLGEPINSPADDFSYGVNQETRYGFFSSNRNPETDTSFVKTNIYSFKEEKPLKDPYIAWIEGCVTDKDTGEPLPESDITLTELEENEIYKSLKTDEEGCYKVEINKYDTYLVRAEKEDYDSDEKVSTPKLEKQTINFQLKRNKQEVTPGVDLAKVLNIPMIYFDFDKFNIRPDAAADLEKVYQVLLEYPELRINIRSHTDSRGSHAYNEALSERRAKSTRKYLIDKGIDPSRLESEGLGETELVNECKDDVPCSVEKHQENRRSEFIILEN